MAKVELKSNISALESIKTKVGEGVHRRAFWLGGSLGFVTAGIKK